MNKKVFIWTGYFSDYTDFERYIDAQDVSDLSEFDEEEDEIAISAFAEDIDLPMFEVTYQKYCRVEGESELEEKLVQLLGNASYVAEVAQRLKETQKPRFNIIILLEGHTHTRYYRGAARPGAPIYFLGGFEDTSLEEK
ncbi:hypothetical protein BKI52_17360 [marine bacterium AO1-C]|nr:hypothetical protein BKI52_17360 [marine bacterium AO1-C]